MIAFTDAEIEALDFFRTEEPTHVDASAPWRQARAQQPLPLDLPADYDLGRRPTVEVPLLDLEDDLLLEVEAVIE